MSHPSTDYPPPPAASQSGGRPYALAGFVCAAVAVFFLPIVLGPAAVVLGFVAHRKGDPLGRWAIAAGVLGTVLGFALGALVFAEVQQSALAALTAG